MHSASATTPAGSRSTARSAHARLAAGKRLLQVEAAVVDVRGDARAQQVRLGHRLQPDGLPDAGGAGVIAAVVGEQARLLAARLGRIVRVAGAHHDRQRFAGFGDAAQVAGEGRKAAAVARDLHAVDPDGGVVIDGLEVQQDVFPGPRLRDG